MLKYLSYLNIFLGIIYFAILRSQQNYLDLIIVPFPVLFSWITLFHLLKNHLKFQRWHIIIGFICVSFSIISTAINIQIVVEIALGKSIIFGPHIFIIALRQIFDLLIFLHFLIAYQTNRKISTT